MSEPTVKVVTEEDLKNYYLNNKGIYLSGNSISGSNINSTDQNIQQGFIQNDIGSSTNLQSIPSRNHVIININETYILTTKDKIKIALTAQEQDRKLTNNWWSFLSVSIAFLIPWFTTEFKDIGIIPGEYFKVGFLLIAIGFGILTVISIIRSSVKKKKLTVEYFIKQIRENDENE